MARSSHRLFRLAAVPELILLAIAVAGGPTRLASAQVPANAPASKIVAPWRPDVTEFFESVSDPYAIGGEMRNRGEPAGTVERAAESKDEGLRELATLVLQMRELHDVHGVLVEAVKLNSAGSALGFTYDVLRRLGTAIRNREDAPPIELVGDLYERQNQVLSTWKLELTARYSGLSLSNLVADKVRAYADERLAPIDAKPPAGSVAIDFVPDGERRGFVRLRNRTGQDIAGCLVVIRVVPDADRVRSIQAVEDFGILPVLFGGSADDVIERKELNALNVRFLSTPQSKLVWIGDFPASAVVEVPPCDSPSFFLLARSCEIALWPSGCVPRSLAIPGLAKVQAVAGVPVTAGTSGGVKPPPQSDPRRELEQLKRAASADPISVLGRLRALRESPASDSTLQTDCEALRKSIVADYQEKQRVNTAAIQVASAEKQKANEDWAAHPGNAAFEARHTAAKKRLEELKKEGGRIRQVLAAR
ncbi:MAG: hypothetical protein ABL886_01990 [Rhodoglobus sp.]